MEFIMASVDSPLVVISGTRLKKPRPFRIDPWLLTPSRMKSVRRSTRNTCPDDPDLTLAFLWIGKRGVVNKEHNATAIWTAEPFPPKLGDTRSILGTFG